ncbi:hypothetical protein OHQ88_04890 [Micromonospora zamorensis]|uniref:Uncharacterized protein n=1 Tax=Micromonospora zamorensis TaxID=709883 RepID=A0ABZ1PI95_9ACTN
MSGRLREIARQTVAIADSGRYRNGAGDEVGIGEVVRAAVADAFDHALREVDRFDHVVFAIRDNLPGTPVYRTFAERFDLG